MAILLCTDDMLVAIPKSKLHLEEHITKRFKCRDRESLPTDIKGLDGEHDGSVIRLSQQSYLDKLPTIPLHISSSDPSRPMTDAELTAHRTIAGRLAWIATASSPSSAFTVSVSLQGTVKQVSLLSLASEALQHAKDKSLASLSNVPLDFGSIHIRIYADGAYQNLKDKHSQIGFVFTLSDRFHRTNIFHWQSSRDTRRPSSTEEAELFALDLALRSIRNQRELVFQPLRKEVLLVLYIDNQTLWCNLMNSTMISLPEVMLRCREYIHEGTIASVCLIVSEHNPADAFTKQKPNQKLLATLRNNHLNTPAKRVFMLQTSPFRNVDFIPTTSVPMPADTTPTLQPQCPSSSSSATPRDEPP